MFSLARRSEEDERTFKLVLLKTGRWLKKKKQKIPEDYFMEGGGDTPEESSLIHNGLTKRSTIRNQKSASKNSKTEERTIRVLNTKSGGEDCLERGLYHEKRK